MDTRVELCNGVATFFGLVLTKAKGFEAVPPIQVLYTFGQCQAVNWQIIGTAKALTVELVGTTLL